MATGRRCYRVCRPALAKDRLRLCSDGRVLVEPKTAWHDGTSHPLFEPIEFMEKLAAIVPRPAVNLLLYHGVLAPHARLVLFVALFCSNAERIYSFHRTLKETNPLLKISR